MYQRWRNDKFWRLEQSLASNSNRQKVQKNNKFVKSQIFLKGILVRSGKFRAADEKRDDVVPAAVQDNLV